MKILVTGATGFLGRKLCERLGQEGGKEIIVLTRDPNHAHEILSGHEIIYGDLLYNSFKLNDRDSKRLYGVSEVYHLAADTKFSRTESTILEHNVHTTQNMLEFFKDRSLKSFNFVGSAYSCGSVDQIVKEDWLALPNRFRNFYEESKWKAEELIKEYNRDFNIPFRIFRPSIILSGKDGEIPPNQTIYSYVNIIYNAINNYSPATKLKIKGDPNGSLNLITRDQVVDLILGLNNEPPNRIYNLTNEENISLRTIAEIVSGVCNLEEGLEFIPYLRYEDLSIVEKFIYKNTKSFWPYLCSTNLEWEIKNSHKVRLDKSIKSTDQDYLKESLSNLLNNK